jgi:LytTr DNA-binding domain
MKARHKHFFEFEVCVLADDLVAQQFSTQLNEAGVQLTYLPRQAAALQAMVRRTILVLQLDHIPSVQHPMVLQWLRNQDRAVICASHDMLDAHKAWILEASDFVLLTSQSHAPVLKTSLERVSKKISALHLFSDENRTVQFPNGSGSVMTVAVNDIVYVEASGDYCWCHTTQKKEAIHARMGVCVEALDAFGFQRVHRSFLVNPRHIKLRRGKVLQMVNGAEIAIAKRRGAVEL